MSIIIDLKNSIRDAINEQDETINFNFNEIQNVEFPYVFFYITNYKIDKAVDTEHWRKLDLMCVVEYMKNETNNSTDLWSYSDNLTNALKLFDFYNTKIQARNINFKIVENVLQMTFDLTIYVKAVDTTDLMRELDLTLKEI